MLRAGYSVLLWLFLPFIAFKLWLRSRKEPGYAKHIGERFGRYSGAITSPVIWVHAVSVGEVRASVPLVKALIAAYPGHVMLLTCMTASGRDAIESAFGKSALGVFLPYDFPHAVTRFLNHFRPRICILMETEIWINLIAGCKKRSIPIILANARMSHRSAAGYQRLSTLMRPAFESLSTVCAQSEGDANRIAALGAHRIEITGNLKFDVEPDPALVAAGVQLKRSFGGTQTLLWASTRDGEEALLLDALTKRGLRPGLMLIIVPRHPQRFLEVASLISRAGLKFYRRSEGHQAAGEVPVILGDTMGEMAAYYTAADVAIIGGSLLPYGGQNLIEACALGAPVVIGPHVYNFSEAARLAVANGAALQVSNAEQALDTAYKLLDDNAVRNAMSEAGVAFCAAHSGATRRHMAVIERALPFAG